MNRGARMVLLGGLKSPGTITINANDLHYKQASFIDSVSYTKSGFKKTIQLIHEGKINVDVLQPERIPVEQLEQAFIDVSQAKGLRKCILF